MNNPSADGVGPPTERTVAQPREVGFALEPASGVFSVWPSSACGADAPVSAWGLNGPGAPPEPQAPAFPEPGTTFLDFRLLGELGRGAFGRVYLAEQGELAGRYVALKVARDIVGDSRTLAQLQHTNIVPIYSYHRAGPLQAV